MDGRVQLPVIKYLQEYFKAEYVDSITEAGPVAVLAEQTNNILLESVLSRLKISVERHNSVGIAIVAHHDCAGNPAPKEKQLKQLTGAVRLIREEYGTPEVVGLWVNEKWQVQLIP